MIANDLADSTSYIISADGRIISHRWLGPAIEESCGLLAAETSGIPGAIEVLGAIRDKGPRSALLLESKDAVAFARL